MRLGREFFERDALVVAPELLGKALVTVTPEGAERRLVITGPEDFPQGVLIRACAGFEGPGKLTRYLGITGALNGADIASSPLIRIEDEGREVYIRTVKRVGIAYADEADRDRLWRFIGEVR